MNKPLSKNLQNIDKTEKFGVCIQALISDSEEKKLAAFKDLYCI